MIRYDPSNVSIYFQLYSKAILSHAAALNLPAVSEGGERRRRGSLTRMIKGKASQPEQADVTAQREVPPACYLTLVHASVSVSTSVDPVREMCCPLPGTAGC